MEITILRVRELKLRDGGGLAVRRHADQMVPAQYLMQHDAVRKAAEPETEDEACANQWLRPRRHTKREL